MTHVVCRQLAPTLGDLAANHGRIRQVIAEETAAGADILVLPELATSGYVFQSASEVDACAIPATDPRIAEWSAAIRGRSVVVCGYAERGDDGAFYNSAVALNASGVLANYRKTHLWDREKLFFTPGTEPAPIVATPYGRVAVMICYDLEFPEYTRRVALDGAALIAVPTNWPLMPRPGGERPSEIFIAQAAAHVNKVAIACCDRTGTERGQEWTEWTSIIDPNGWLTATATAHAARADLDLAQTHDKTLSPRNDLFDDRRTDLYLPH